TSTTLKKKKWMVNSAMRPSDWDSHYFMDLENLNGPLYDKIRGGHFTVLFGTRASGKSTRALYTINQLEQEGFICNYISFEHINTNNFWVSFGRTLSRNGDDHFDSCSFIDSSESFLDCFNKKTHGDKLRIVIFIDEFDGLFEADAQIRSEVLNVFRGIRNSIAFTIHSIVAIGTFSILHIDSDIDSESTSPLSPFNIKEAIQNRYFILEQVESLFNQFAEDLKISIDKEIIEDIYTLTNGHAGLVCLCGRAIENNLIKSIEESNLKYNIWKRFSVTSLVWEAIAYSTFQKMVNTLLKKNSKRAVDFFRFYFMTDINPRYIYVVENVKLAEFLAAEGVLLPCDEHNKFRIASPLIRWMILQRVIPEVYPSCPSEDIPFDLEDPEALDMFNVLKLAICTFDKEIIRFAVKNSYKIAKVQTWEDYRYGT
ncbi:5561_t:CDS:2, partial [Funneliformis geosporum]